MQTLDAAATAALEAGETTRVCYDTGYTRDEKGQYPRIWLSK